MKASKEDLNKSHKFQVNGAQSGGKPEWKQKVAFPKSFGTLDLPFQLGKLSDKLVRWFCSAAVQIATDDGHWLGLATQRSYGDLKQTSPKAALRELS